MKATRSYEASKSTYPKTKRYNSNDRNLKKKKIHFRGKISPHLRTSTDETYTVGPSSEATVNPSHFEMMDEVHEVKDCTRKILLKYSNPSYHNKYIFNKR
jgi:hypothetical protein